MKEKVESKKPALLRRLDFKSQGVMILDQEVKKLSPGSKWLATWNKEVCRT